MTMSACNPHYVYFGPIWDHLNTLGSQTCDFVVWGPRWDHLNTLGSQTCNFVVWGPRWKLRTGRVIYSKLKKGLPCFLSKYDFFSLFLLELHSTRQILTTHVHLPLWIYVRKPYPYEHLRKIEPTDHEIYEITTDASLSTETSSITASI